MVQIWVPWQQTVGSCTNGFLFMTPSSVIFAVEKGETSLLDPILMCFWGELNCNVLLREAYECLPNCIDFFEEHSNICISDWFNERLLIKFLNLKIRQNYTISPWSLPYVRNWSLKFQASTIGPSSFQNEQYKSFS